MFHAFVLIRREEGFSGLYKGVTAAIAVIPFALHALCTSFHVLILQSVAPFSGLNFALYETLKEILLRSYPDAPTRWTAGCGSLSGAIAMTILYPLDLLKRQMMMQGVGMLCAFACVRFRLCALSLVCAFACVRFRLCALSLVCAFACVCAR
jgi:hypothetical protein